MDRSGNTNQSPGAQLERELRMYMESTAGSASLPNLPPPKSVWENSPASEILDPLTVVDSPLFGQGIGNPGITNRMWRDGIKTGVNSIMKRDFTVVINFGLDLLLGQIFQDETKEDPTLKLLDDISNRLSQISRQLTTIINMLEKLTSEVEAQKFRADIAQASTIRDPLQREIELINTKLANAGKDEDLRREIIKRINTTTVSGNSFYQQAMAMGDTIIRTMNQSQMDIFHILEAIVIPVKLPWDHQECQLYSDLVSYYMGTYLQGMAYAKLSILYQLELNKKDPVEYNYYVSMFDILFSGNAKAGIVSSAQRVEKAFKASPVYGSMMEHDHYAHYRPQGGFYVLRDTTFWADRTTRGLKPVSKARLEEILAPGTPTALGEAIHFVLGHFAVLEKIGFQFKYLPWWGWLTCTMQLLTIAEKPGMGRDKFFGELGGLTISKDSRYQNFKQIGGFAGLTCAHDSCVLQFYELLGNEKRKHSGSLTLRSSKKGMEYFDVYEPSNDLRPLLIISQTKPKNP